ncbi:leukocyte-specific transcript 1 protein isoform X2 [Zalophus californianus]|uniref:Leukocyte-specific transcript 1 protein isoform X2 n=2 Tax=Zalophus californianus TaxID=9704 RepID=A0A6J2DYC5_ZALCA|nr:leukocyte-specific transcript 1 protein isoform X2 [Zalophus californianus]XP_027976263.1 leukocyte-specific transcript 1 protein isoform X2 [Eumetopias jubatus]
MAACKAWTKVCALTYMAGAWGWGGSCSWLWSLCPPVCVGSIGKAQLSEQELHYASLLPVPWRERPDLSHREDAKEEPSTEYACIAKN